MGNRFGAIPPTPRGFPDQSAVYGATAKETLNLAIRGRRFLADFGEGVAQGEDGLFQGQRGAFGAGTRDLRLAEPGR